MTMILTSYLNCSNIGYTHNKIITLYYFLTIFQIICKPIFSLKPSYTSHKTILFRLFGVTWGLNTFLHYINHQQHH